MRNEQSAFVLSGHGAHHRVLAGAQDVAGIRKQGRHLDGAGAGVHLPVGEREPAVVRMRGPVGQDQFQLQMMKRVGPRETEILLLADGEDRFDGIQRGYGSHRGARRGDQIADLNGCGSGDPVDQRCQPGEAEVHLCGFESGVGCFHRGGRGFNLRLRGLHLGLGRGYLRHVGLIGLRRHYRGPAG